MGIKKLVFVLLILFTIPFVSATEPVLFSDQGTNVRTLSTNALVRTGNLTITIYDAISGGTVVYNNTFLNGVVNGSWNVQINTSMDYGNTYYKDYNINNDNLNFSGGVDRIAFQSPLGLFTNASLFNFSIVSSCATGSSIRVINKNGTVQCQTDNGITSETDPIFGAQNSTMWTNIYNKYNASYESTYNASYESTYNSTYDTWSYNQTSSMDRTFWYNQSLSSYNTYGTWWYNQSLSLYNTYGTWWNNQTSTLDYTGFYSTYNGTYDTRSYNQTSSIDRTFWFNQSLSLFNSYGTWWYNQSLSLYNTYGTWWKNQTSTLDYTGFYSTYNSTYDTKVGVEGDPAWSTNLTSGSSGNWIPLTNVTQEIGTSIKRWLNGWFQNLTVSQNVTVGNDVNARFYYGNLTQGSFPSSSCTGTDKVSSIGANGKVTCTADQSGAGSLTSKMMNDQVSTTSAVAYTVLNDLNITLSSNSNYTVECKLIMLGGAATTGVQLQIQTTGMANVTWTYNSPLSATTIEMLQGLNVQNNTFADLGSGTANIRYAGLVWGYLSTNATTSPKVYWQMKSEVAASLALIDKGSVCGYNKIN